LTSGKPGEQGLARKPLYRMIALLDYLDAAGVRSARCITQRRPQTVARWRSWHRARSLRQETRRPACVSPACSAAAGGRGLCAITHPCFAGRNEAFRGQSPPRRLLREGLAPTWLGEDRW